MIKILELKSHRLPNTWCIRKLRFVTKDEYDRYQSTDFLSSQPVVANIFDSVLRLMPPPKTSGQSIVLSCFLADSDTQISNSKRGTEVEPEIKDYFDKAIEYYTTSELADDPKLKEYWMGKFKEEIGKYEGKPHITHQEGITPECNW